MTTVLYLGADEGVRTLRSEDGEHWEMSAGEIPDFSVEEVLVPPGRPNVVVAGTRGDGVWVSDDFGATFSKPCNGRRGPGKVRCLALDPSDPNRVFAGGEPIDLYVSDDFGANWELLESVRAHPEVPSVTYPVPRTEPHVRDIAIDPTDAETIYLALQVGSILKTTDGGASWEQLHGGVDSDVHTLAIDAGNPRHLLVATGGYDSRRGVAGRALYSSADGGESWQPLAMNFTQEYSIPIVAKPGQPEVLYAGLATNNPSAWRKRDTGAEGLMIRTKDGGASWEALDTTAIEGFSRAFTAAIAVDESEPERVFAALNDGTLITSRDSGSTWWPLGVRQKGTNDLKCTTV